MLFAAITHERISDKFQGMTVRDFQHDDFFITFVYDEFYSKIVCDDKFYQIFETSSLAEKEPGDSTYLSFCFNRFDKKIILEKRQISGRPLYYYIGTNGDFYCSTHLGMLKKSGAPMQANESVLPEFFMYRYVAPPQSLVKDVKLVFPGSVLEFSRRADKYHEKTVSRYNPISTGETLKDAKNVDIAYIAQALDKPMRSLEPETPVHFPLSGGLDSSILLSVLRQQRELSHTYSAGYPFEEPDNNIEKEYALSAAKAFGTHHHYFEFSNEKYLKGVVEAIAAAEEPIFHLQSVLLHLLFKEGMPATDRAFVVSGEGADSLWGTEFNNKLFALQSQPPKRGLSYILSQTARREFALHKSLSASYDDPDHVLWSLGRCGDLAWIKNNLGASVGDTLTNKMNHLDFVKDLSLLDQCAISSLLTAADHTQIIWSKLTEAHRKVMIYPFNETDVHNYAFQMDWSIKVKEPKVILRQVAEQLNIPAFIITRPKGCFAILHKEWARPGGTFQPLVNIAEKVFDKKVIESVQIPKFQKSMTFWNILNYAIWKRLIIDGESTDTLIDELELH